MEWTIRRQGFDPAAAAENGNRFLIGNGYLGMRGALEEHGKEQLAAVNLAGIYDKVGDGWREPLNAPNPLFTHVAAVGQTLSLPGLEPESHVQSLDFRYGVMARRTVWALPGVRVTVEGQRFACLDQPHLIAQRYEVTADADVEITLTAGIDADVWDIHGPHYARVEPSFDGPVALSAAFVQNGRDEVAVARKSFLTPAPAGWDAKRLSEGLVILLKAGAPVVLTSVSAVYTTKDVADPLGAARSAVENFGPDAWERLLASTRAAWDAVWARSLVEIEGDPEAEKAVNYSVYHLNCIAPRHHASLSIPARGLSGQTYKGAVFWDSEIFLLDYFLFTQPEVARSLVNYRVQTLPGALKKAEEYGYRGAFYAWESQEGGYDACSDYNVTDVFTSRPVRTYFKDRQVHISAAVAWAIMRYVNFTGDEALLIEGGARVVLECARFYRSRLVLPFNTLRYELHDVIGPDEYHERVNNNAYTSRMARFTFDSALEAARRLKARAPESYEALRREIGLDELIQEIEDARARLYVPEPGPNGLIEQFSGYFALEDPGLEAVRGRLKDPREYWGGASGVASDTQVIKQADVVTILEMFHAEYPREVLRANWAYYEPRTEHGSSLSACMYALLACRFGRADLAYPFFLKSARADLVGGGKQWAGLVYIGGTHPAAAGGAWKTLALGFAGLRFEEGRPALSPCLPENWTRLRFRFVWDGGIYLADIAPDGARLEQLKPA